VRNALGCFVLRGFNSSTAAATPGEEATGILVGGAWTHVRSWNPAQVCKSPDNFVAAFKCGSIREQSID
jgi:hypothetical protein